jgi:hypothetical protein
MMGVAALISAIALLPSRQQSAGGIRPENQLVSIPAAYGRAADLDPLEFDCEGEARADWSPAPPYMQELKPGQSIEGVIVERRGDDIFIQRIKCSGGGWWQIAKILTLGQVGGDCKESNKGNRRLIRWPFREAPIQMKCCDATKTIVQVTKLR